MIKIGGKGLNNKGFTLIELLAVVVILAVVMGIAMTSVISSMNSARAGALSDSATSVAQALNQKYTESLVSGAPTNVYGDVITNGYDFSTSGVYYLTDGLSDELNISKSTLRLNNTAEKLAAPDAGANYKVNQSFITYDAAKGRFVVCLIANNSGNNFVVGNAIDYTTEDTAKKAKIIDVTVNTFKVNFVSTAASGAETNVMYSCSDGQKSW